MNKVKFVLFLQCYKYIVIFLDIFEPAHYFVIEKIWSKLIHKIIYKTYYLLQQDWTSSNNNVRNSLRIQLIIINSQDVHMFRLIKILIKNSEKSVPLVNSKTH